MKEITITIKLFNAMLMIEEEQFLKALDLIDLVKGKEESKIIKNFITIKRLKGAKPLEKDIESIQFKFQEYKIYLVD